MCNFFMFAAFALFASGGIAAYALSKNEKASAAVGTASACAALALAAVHTVLELSSCNTVFSLAVFRFPIIIVGMAAAIHSTGYLAGHFNGKTGVFHLFFNLTLGAMYAVTAADGIMPFLIAWELMGLFSFALVAFESSSKQTMRAAWIYLLACEAGGLLIIMLAKATAEGSAAVALFALAAVAFGLKAGFPLLHVWLPEAHPAAPAPVSAVMSGAMIPLGFLALFRFMPQTPALYGVCGWTLLCAGAAGAFSGILSGAAQKNIKRLLAYSSVENIGIISMGFGIGFLGVAYGFRFMSACGFAGAYLHIINHALLKGALFLGAGSVLKSAHTLNMDQLGGLMKKMPFTGGLFTAASLGICGLPPFCGFTGELLIYSAGFSGIAGASGALFAASLGMTVILALTGGTACAAFVKTVSAVFQGEPRTDHAINAAPEEKGMVSAIVLLTIPALAMPFIAPFLPGISSYEPVREILMKNAIFSLVFGGFVALIAALRAATGSDTRRVGTWDCGFAKPTARMEYTGTAFVQPVLDFFNGFLRQKKHLQRPEGLFPDKASIDVESDDFGERFFWRPVFVFFANAAEKIHRFQSGYLHLYILVMIIALAVMLLAGFAPEILKGGK